MDGVVVAAGRGRGNKRVALNNRKMVLVVVENVVAVVVIRVVMVVLKKSVAWNPSVVNDVRFRSW